MLPFVDESPNFIRISRIHQQCRNPADPNRVSDNVLRWHFRQSILRNMRGAGEPSWEHDFPPGSDMLREILEGPFPIERFEMELSARLQGWPTRPGLDSVIRRDKRPKEGIWMAQVIRDISYVLFFRKLPAYII